MNREVDKEKDIHDGICLTLFILFLFFSIDYDWSSFFCFK